MGFFKKRSNTAVMYCDNTQFNQALCSGYTTLANNPEVCTAVDRIANLIGSMTLHLMQNSDSGDIRLKNNLTKLVDISPNKYMNRSNFIHWIVRTLFLEGNGNAIVLPKTANGKIEELEPVPAATVSFLSRSDIFNGYVIFANGQKYNPDEVLHFVLNPAPYEFWRGQGYKVVLADLANNLKQAASTEKIFMQNQWKPSFIVKVDALSESFATKAGRKKLLEEYVETSTAGEPWILPADNFSVEQVKPLTLADLALADFVKLDKQTVAAILGVPAFVLGVGDFKREAWNSFVSSTIMPIAQILEQEFTRKLIVSDKEYFKFNPRSLYAYELTDMAKIATDLFVRGIMTGNEARDWLGLSPLNGLDELVILENYIPLDRISDQKKLKSKGGED